MSKLMSIREKEILQIMDLYRKSTDQRVIANKINISQRSVGIIIRAFNGNNNILKLLNVRLQEDIKRLSPFYNKKNDFKINNQVYVCELIWGLIKLQFKPKN